MIALSLKLLINEIENRYRYDGGGELIGER